MAKEAGASFEIILSLDNKMVFQVARLARKIPCRQSYRADEIASEIEWDRADAIAGTAMVSRSRSD